MPSLSKEDKKILEALERKINKEIFRIATSRLRVGYGRLVSVDVAADDLIREKVLAYGVAQLAKHTVLITRMGILDNFIDDPLLAWLKEKGPQVLDNLKAIPSKI